MNLTHIDSQELDSLPFYCTKVVLDPDISRTLNAEAVKKLQDQVPSQVWETFSADLKIEEIAVDHVVDYVKSYLRSKDKIKFYAFRDDKISMHWEEAESQWYIKLYHWQLPTPLFSSEFQKLIKQVKIGKAKIPIPEPDLTGIQSIDERKVDIVNDLLLQVNPLFTSKEENEQVEEGDQVLLKIITIKNTSSEEKTYFMNSTFDGNYQLYEHILGSSLGDKKRVGIVTVDYNPEIIEFEILEIKSLLTEVESLEEIDEDIILKLGFESKELFEKYLQDTAQSGYDEDCLLALINSLDIVFEHHCSFPDLPLQLLIGLVESELEFNDVNLIEQYFINKGFAETFLDFQDENPSIVNMFVKAWSLKRITFKDPKDPSLWNLNYGS